jgi:acyl-CoA synthetase (AMP-forming)/AMP-acid ligase II
MLVAVVQTSSSSSSSSETGSQQQHAIELTADAEITAAAAAGAIERTATKHASSGRNSSKGLLVPLPVGREGEVWLTGPGLAAGYLTQQYASDQQRQQQQPPQRFLELQLQLQHLHQAAGVLTTAAADKDPRSSMQQQPPLSVAAGPGVNLAAAASHPQVWFRTGDIGKMQADGEPS